VHDWIARWKTKGGGFYCKESAEGVMVQLASQQTNTATAVDIYRADLERLQTELVSNPRLKMAVSSLVRDTWERALLQNVEPKGHA